MRLFERLRAFEKGQRTSRWAGWLIAIAFAALGASPPEVVKVRVPSSKVSSWFPPGSDLQVLPPDRFEELVRAVRDRPPAPIGPRVLRARHSARWDSGMLSGRSEMTIGPPTEVGLVVLEPWSPVLTGQGTGANLLRATADGRLGLKVEPTGPSSVGPEWRLRARPGSDGRAFAPALPEFDVASLTLDLPAGLVPEANAGPRIGPEPGPSPGRATWRFEAARGRIDLRLRDPSEDANRAGGPSLWLEGPTRIDLSASPANWRADWTLDESPGAPRRLTIELDPGLELVDVTGPRVASFRVEATGPSTRVAIRLDGEGSGPSSLKIRAICHAPAEGAWAVPSARPIDATWTGGRTTVRLDPSRVLQACRERSGRRVAPRGGDPVDLPTLIFEPKGEAGPVAELTFRKPSADATVEVRGHLRLGDDIPRIEVALTWTVERGRLLSHAADLPPGWTPDRVLSATRQPVAWHGDALSNGGTRVHIGPALPDEESRSLTLTLVASARQAGVTGPLDLPRVRPAAGTRVVDEVWVATPDPNLTLRPILARGLAWLDPPLDDVPTPRVADDLRGALAWRWLADDAEARIDRVPIVDVPSGEVRLDASIEQGQLRLDWALTIDSSRGDLRSIPIHLDEPPESPIRWRSREAGGPTVEARPLGDDRRAALGFPSTGSAWELELAAPSRGRIELRGRADRPWDGRGRLPLLTLPKRFRTKGLVAIEVEDTTRVKLDTSGLTPIDLSESSRDGSAKGEDAAIEGESRARRAAMFGYRSSGGRLNIETTRGEVDPKGGLVREAYLVSQFFPRAGLRHRLTLKISTDTARSIDLKMPGGCPVDRIRRDGQPVSPTPSAGAFRIEIPAPAPGRSTSRLTIDYRTDDNLRSGRLEPSRLLPECSLPCLSFAWEIVAPEPWAVGEIAGLAATDPRPASSMTAKLLGFSSISWSRPKSNAAGESMLGELNKAASEIADGETNLGDWLLKLDAGRWPLVVDRLALVSAGWGPRSRITPDASEPNTLGPVMSVLRPMGLTAYPLNGMILITASSEAPDRPADRDAWSSALREVPASGSDVTDRFQSAARWWGEMTPRALSAGELLDRPPGPNGWHARRLVAPGWPPLEASVALIDERWERAWAWLIAASILAVGMVARRQPATIRAIGLVVIGAAASLALAWTWPDPSMTAAGLARGFLALLAFWTGRSLRPSASQSSIHPSEAPTASRRSGIAVGIGTASVVLLAVGLVSTAISAGPGTDAPIVVLLPFDGPPDPTAKPDRVVLLLDDYERLKRLARPEEPALVSRALLSAASHRVVREEPGLATVVSLYEVEVEGNGPVSWSLPVGMARDLSATVDARATPLAITTDGLSATVPIAGPGTHAVQFRRSVPLSTIGPGGERARLPVNRAAFARISVARGEGPRWVEVPGASGSLDVRGEGIEGGLGPVEALEVRWFPNDRPPSSTPRGPVEATFLWDARPVGDLIRVRLAHSDPDGASTIQLSLEPGLLVRRFSIPDVVGVRVEGSADRPEWVAHVDPPLPRDVPIEVDLWRPVVSGAADRRWPRVEVPGAGRFSALLGFRRPSDWSGRLEPRGEIEAVPEASFVKSWGILPDDGLTLAGAVRFGRSSNLGVSTGPVPLRRSVRPKVLVDLGPGRLDVAIEAVVTDQQGRSFELEMGVPADLRVVRVEASGLVDWQKVDRGRLRLQFDGAEAPDRNIRIEGYLPVQADSAMTEARSYQAKVPWPSWFDAESGPGTLVVSGPTRFQVEAGEGVAALPPIGPADPNAVFRSFFRVDRPSGLSPVRWSAPPAKVGVSVRSDLTIDPDTLTWTAVVVCDISGGPADSLHWNLPTEWAKAATLEIEGLSHRLVAEPKGAKGETTLWTILPDSPIWGRARMVLRSKRPIRPDEPFNYPEIAPLAAPGRGSVERYDLAIANVSGRPLEIAGKPGLQPIDVSRFRSEESPSPPGSIGHAFHVTGDRWSLRVRVGRSAGDLAGREGGTARVALAQFSCVLGTDGETWGRARYDLEPRPGPFLAVQVPDRVDLPWASVDGLIVPVLRDGDGRRLVPLGDREARRVDLSWHSASHRHPSDRPGTIDCPTTEQAVAPTLFSVAAPSSMEIAVQPSRKAERLNRADWEVEDAERLARRVVDSMLDLDRSSPRDREQLLDDLVEIELKGRCLARESVPPNPVTEAARGRLQAVLASIAEASETAGLDDLVQEARARVGLAQEFQDSADVSRPGPIEPVRDRRVGRSQFFRWSGAGPGGSLPIFWNSKPPSSHWRMAQPWAIATIGLIASLVLGRLVARSARPSGRVSISLALLVVILLLAWEPLGTASALVLVGLGRWSG